MEDAGVTVEVLVDELKKLGFTNPKKFFADDGSVKMMKDLDDDAAACIAGVEVSELFKGKDVADGPQQKTVSAFLLRISSKPRPRSSAIPLKLLASSANSSRPQTGTRTLTSPVPNWRTPTMSRSTGRCQRRVLSSGLG